MKKTILLTLIVACVFASCRKEGCVDSKATNYDEKAKKDDGSCKYDESIDVPATYSFENVDYSGQTARLKLTDSLVSLIKTASNSNPVAYQDLMDIYENKNGLFGSSKKLSDKIYSAVSSEMTGYFNTIADISTNGTGQEIDGRYYTADGIEIDQLVEKGIMGSVFYYQALSVYLMGIENDDNETVEVGKGTEMEHHFDEAFGYFGAPIDFTDNEVTGGAIGTTANYWAKYAVSRNAQLNNKQVLFDAFLKARTAISNKDIETAQTHIATIYTEWEKIAAANVVHYINDIKSDLAANSTGDFYHHWNEGIAFAKGLDRNANKIITASDLTTVIDAFKSKPTDISSGSEFDAALTILQNTYGFSNDQMLNL